MKTIRASILSLKTQRVIRPKLYQKPKREKSLIKFTTKSIAKKLTFKNLDKLQLQLYKIIPKPWLKRNFNQRNFNQRNFNQRNFNQRNFNQRPYFKSLDFKLKKKKQNI